MKMNGKTIEGMKPEVIVIPKGGVDYVFKAAPVLNYDDFEKLCPVPVAPTIVRPGGVESADATDKDYLGKIEKWSQYKVAWMVLTSLKATDELIWDTVDEANPDSWNNYRDELALNFTDVEISLIFDLVMNACGLNQDKIDEATKRFLATQA